MCAAVQASAAAPVAPAENYALTAAALAGFPQRAQGPAQMRAAESGATLRR
jgi:hypothetical protein